MNYCQICKYEFSICICVQKCEDCMLTVRHNSTLNKSEGHYCICESKYISSLRTKLQKDNDFNFEEQIQYPYIGEEENLITDAEQTNIGEIIDHSLDKLNLDPVTPGLILNLQHLDEKKNNRS
jgi:hypothetical protein